MSYRTTLLQKRVSSATDALQEFRSARDDAFPLVLVPDDRWCCSCMLAVPSGPHCILHRWGKDIDPEHMAQPGLHLCSPACERIAYCVTQQACTYNAPVKSCPTADNVMVDCDLTLMFMIGPDPIRVKKFVYNLGARRFDEFLFAAVEEGIRHLIRSCLHTEVYELRGNSDERVRETLDELNRKFNLFGVDFQSAAITDVKFKPELQNTLQSTTEFKAKIGEEEKKHKNLMNQIDNQQTRDVVELDKQNIRSIQDSKARRDRLLIDRDRIGTETKGRAEVAIEEANNYAVVRKVRAESEKNVAQTQGMQKLEEAVAVAGAKDKAARIQVDQETKTLIYESEQRLANSKNQADALIAEAQAEEKAAGPLKLKREYQLKMAQLEVLGGLAQNTNIVISGDMGDRLIDKMLAQNIVGDISLTDS